MQDNRKSSLVARISIQVVDYYRQAMRGLEDSNISSLLGSKKSKTWKKMLTIKMNHFTSVAYVSGFKTFDHTPCDKMLYFKDCIV